jgi:hypothetical protein
LIVKSLEQPCKYTEKPLQGVNLELYNVREMGNPADQAAHRPQLEMTATGDEVAPDNLDPPEVLLRLPRRQCVPVQVNPGLGLCSLGAHPAMKGVVSSLLKVTAAAELAPDPLCVPLRVKL